MSLLMRALEVAMRLAFKPRMATVARARKRLAAPKASTEPPARLRKQRDVRSRQLNGFEVHTVLPRGRTPQRAVLYVHGGSYVSGIAPQHWALIGALADAGLRVEVPHYGLAPQHTHRDAYPFVTEVYRQLLDDADGVTIAGDSAGGGLALGLAQTLPDAGLPQPERIVLLSPWLDLTLSHSGLPAVEAHDPWLSSVGLRVAGEAWAGGDDPTQPRLSPGNGQLAGLAPIDVYVGTHEIGLPDGRLLIERARAAGVLGHAEVCEGAVHVYPLTPTPEGRAATRRIVQRIAG
ncbi:alpha/beta hydrolase fold domain-containing protein [Modestobacter sp. L9-4]|uniref:alpha/beta hydrolase fold domain-containing protein n=1 Tax=Modestobacter sp. L9-4 TaxID=2851567 RepID=UPI001F2B1C13|nr:alpha/beta hydrolase [Modestobacter sp. L9-4]